MRRPLGGLLSDQAIRGKARTQEMVSSCMDMRREEWSHDAGSSLAGPRASSGASVAAREARSDHVDRLGIYSNT